MSLCSNVHTLRDMPEEESGAISRTTDQKQQQGAVPIAVFRVQDSQSHDRNPTSYEVRDCRTYDDIEQDAKNPTQTFGNKLLNVAATQGDEKSKLDERKVRNVKQKGQENADQVFGDMKDYATCEQDSTHAVNQSH